MPKTLQNKEHKDGIPLWLKRVGAAIGIIATLVTIFTGIYTLVHQFKEFTLEIEKERTKQSQAAQAQSENQVIQKTIERDIKKQEFQIENERTKQREAEKKRALFELEKQKNEMSQEEAARLRNETMQREQKVLQAISDFVDSDKPALSALLVLAEYAETTGDYQDLILTAFVAKSENTQSLAEVRLIFKLFNEIGAHAFQAVMQINRMALSQFSRALLRLFWTQTGIAIESALANAGENQDEEMIQVLVHNPPDLIAPVIRRLSQHILSIEPKFQWLIMTEEWANFETSYRSTLLPAVDKVSLEDIKRALKQIQTLYITQDAESIQKKLIVQGEILKQSTQFIEKYFPQATQVEDDDGQRIDLSNAYLVGCKLRGDSILLSLDFHNALFRPDLDILDDTLKIRLDRDSEKSFKMAKQQIEQRLQRMEQFMTL